MAAVAKRLAFSASRRAQRGWKTALIFAAPALVLFTVFIVLPVVEAASASFYNWNGLRAPSPENFIGLGNFEQLLGNRTFHRAALNTRRAARRTRRRAKPVIHEGSTGVQQATRKVENVVIRGVETGAAALERMADRTAELTQEPEAGPQSPAGTDSQEGEPR